jgi:hypothetical protein
MTDRAGGAPGAVDRVEAIFAGVAAALFLVMQSTSFFHDELESRLTDSRDYLRLGHQSLWSLDFWAGDRPPGFPLVWKLLDFGDAPLLVLQVVLGAVAWLALGWQVSRLFRHRGVRMLAIAVILLIGLSPQVMLWNGIAGTESLSISLLCLGLALALAIARRGGRPWEWAVLAVVGLVWALVRDANAWFLLLAGLAALVWWGVAFVRTRATPASKPAARSALIPVVLLALFGVNYLSAGHGERWKYPYSDVLAFRVLPDDARTEWFAERGMPRAEVRALVRDYSDGANLFDLIKSPKYRQLRAWVDADGRSTYARYLLTHPGFVADGASSSLAASLASDQVDAYGLLWLYDPPPTDVLTDVVYPRSEWLILVWSLLALAALVVVWRRAGADDRRWVVAVVLSGVASLVVFVVVWAADPYEIARHEIVPVLVLRLVLWFATLFALDRLVPTPRGQPAERKFSDDPGTISR